jgi:hypothetical protein
MKNDKDQKSKMNFITSVPDHNLSFVPKLEKKKKRKKSFILGGES